MENVTGSLSVFDFLLKGGLVMIPLLLLSLSTVYLFIERWLYMRKAMGISSAFMNDVKNYLSENDIQKAKWVSSREESAFGRIIYTGLNYLTKPIKDIDLMLENAAGIEVGEMEKNLRLLSIIAGIAPMLGFIGTISGIIRIFHAISVTGTISIANVSGGLYEKMIASGCGLLVGMIAFIAFHLLQQKISKFILQVQRTTMEFMNIIQNPSK